MPGWDSLETVARIHGAAEIVALVLLALLFAGAVLLFRQLRRGGWPEWINVGSYQVRNVAFEVAAGLMLVLLLASALIAYGYGARQNAMMAAAEQARADQLRHSAEARANRPDDAKPHPADETQGRQADEAQARQAAGNAPPQPQPGELTNLRRKLSETETQISELQRKSLETERQRAEAQRKLSESESRIAELQRKSSEAENQRAEVQRKLSETENQIAEQQRKLSESENRIAELQRRPPETGNQVAELQRKLAETEKQVADLHRKEMQKRLSDDEKTLLIEALKPFAGQNVAIASRLGDEDGKALAQDFVAVFKAAGWDYGGDGGISVQRWDRDPVGVEITLNEADARAGRVSSGIGALINAVRKLGLSYDNTIYMNRQVPAGKAVVRVGRKLPK